MCDSLLTRVYHFEQKNDRLTKRPKAKDKSEDKQKGNINRETKLIYRHLKCITEYIKTEVKYKNKQET
jgi:hypothetical protein